MDIKGLCPRCRGLLKEEATPDELGCIVCGWRGYLRTESKAQPDAAIVAERTRQVFETPEPMEPPSPRDNPRDNPRDTHESREARQQRRDEREQRRLVILRMFHEGEQRESIAHAVGVSARHVFDVLQEAGLSITERDAAWATQQKAYILPLRRAGFAFDTIARKLDLHVSTVRAACEGVKGLPSRGKRDTRDLSDFPVPQR